MIELVRLILARHDMKVLGALDADEGIQIMREARPDLVLLDIMLPKRDGWSVFQQVRSDPQLKDVPIIVVTARSQPADVVLARYEAKVDDYLRKPFGPRDILQSIQKVLARAPQAA